MISCLNCSYTPILAAKLAYHIDSWQPIIQDFEFVDWVVEQSFEETPMSQTLSLEKIELLERFWAQTEILPSRPMLSRYQLSKLLAAKSKYSDATEYMDVMLPLVLEEYSQVFFFQ